MRHGRRRFLAVVGGSVAGLSGCSFPDAPEANEPGRTRTLTPAPASPTPPAGTPGPATDYRYTSLTPGGNRVVGGSLDLAVADPIDLPLGAAPRWIVARPEPDGPGADWVAVAEDGSVSAGRVSRDGTRVLDVVPSAVEPEAPPVLRATGRVTLLSSPEGASTLTHPLPLGRNGLLYVRRDGAVVCDRTGSPDVLELDALPDARPRLVDEGRVALLAGATDRYSHGALGDGVEAGRLVVLDVAGRRPSVTAEMRPERGVVEGLAPMVADRGSLLHVTESDPDGGARQVTYDTSGTRAAVGPPVGRGFRWRHQLCVAPFAPDGVPELAVVRTPHIGGTAEFYRRDGSELRIVATESGVSSHAIDSRVLDGGFAGDVDGDGRPELVVPDDARRALVIVERTSEGAETAARVPIGDRLTSNVHAVGTTTGLQVGVGRPGGLRVWA